MRSLHRLLGKALVVAEADGATITPSTLSAVTAAAKLGPVSAFLAGHHLGEAAKALAAVRGVERVFVADGEQFAKRGGEEVAKAIEDVVKKVSPTHIVAAASSYTKPLIPRIAGPMKSMPLTNVTEINGEDTFTRLAFAGNAVTKVSLSAPVKFLLVRPTSFEKADATGGSAEVSAVELPAPAELSTFVEDRVSAGDTPDLLTATTVVSGGRAVGNKENFKIIEDLAAPLKAAVGATRAAVDAGYAPNDTQVGQTGKTVAPTLYIAVGLSGAIQHVAGMKDSKVIVCINKDPDAPIFSIADYGLVGDLFTVVPELTKKLQAA